MYYPIAIEPGDDKHAFGVVVPDLPGCFSAGDSLDDAILLHLEGLLDEGKAASGQPGPPSPVDMHAAQSGLAAKADFKGNHPPDAVERVNITYPKRVLTAADR